MTFFVPLASRSSRSPASRQRVSTVDARQRGYERSERGGEQMSPASRQRVSTVDARQRGSERSERGGEQMSPASRQRVSTVDARQRGYERSERGGEQMRRTVLITGGTGVVGSALLPQLRRHRLVALAHRRITPGEVITVHGDVTLPRLG